MPIDQLIDIDDHRLGLIFMRFIFSQDFQKYGLFVHFNDENCDKIVIFSHRWLIRYGEHGHTTSLGKDVSILAVRLDIFITEHYT